MKRRSQQRGVAVITALLLTTLAITIVASLFWQQQVQVRSMENQRLQLQAKWILRGALDWARLILREDGKFSPADYLGEPWAVPLSETRLDDYVEKGRTDSDASDAALSGSIIDAQSRYNLANLSAGGMVKPREVAVLARLLTNLHLPAGLAQAIADAFAATQKNTAAAAGGGADTPQPLPMTQVDDLLAVPGMTAEVFDTLKDFVIILPRPTSVNVNTAPAEVLAARLEQLTMSDANALLASRQQAYFRDVPDFLQRLPGRNPNAAVGEIATKTDYFIVNGKVRLDRAGQEVRALVGREGTGMNVATKVLWIREN
jgi:general secretion pathway protein K